MYCQKCGNKLNGDDLFCQKCGTKVNVLKEMTDDDKKKIVDENQTISKISNKKEKNILVAVVAIVAVVILVKCIGKKVINNNYKICPDLEVQTTTVNDNEGYVVVKNTSSQTIKDFTVAYVGFDGSGNAVKLGYSSTYDTTKFTSVNILPESVYGLERDIYLGNNDVRYIDAIVSSVTYKDGSTWTTDGLDAWATDAVASFSVETYRENIESMKMQAALAESNPYIEIISSRKYDNNRFSSKDDLDVNVKNIGEDTVKGFKLIVMEYDSNGYAIGNNWGFVLDNATKANCDAANLNQGDSGAWNWSLFFESNCNSYNILVYSVELKDGTEWTNEYALQWMLYNEDER